MTNIWGFFFSSISLIFKLPLEICSFFLIRYIVATIVEFDYK
jgi:hypothetical protein